jgi:hypothetical protein
MEMMERFEEPPAEGVETEVSAFKIDIQSLKPAQAAKSAYERLPPTPPPSGSSKCH